MVSVGFPVLVVVRAARAAPSCHQCRRQSHARAALLPHQTTGARVSALRAAAPSALPHQCPSRLARFTVVIPARAAVAKARFRAAIGAVSPFLVLLFLASLPAALPPALTAALAIVFPAVVSPNVAAIAVTMSSSLAVVADVVPSLMLRPLNRNSRRRRPSLS